MKKFQLYFSVPYFSSTKVAFTTVPPGETIAFPRLFVADSVPAGSAAFRLEFVGLFVLRIDHCQVGQTQRVVRRVGEQEKATAEAAVSCNSKCDQFLYKNYQKSFVQHLVTLHTSAVVRVQVCRGFGVLSR